MKKAFNKLAILCSCLLMWTNMSAQDTVFFEVKSLEGNCGQSICVPIEVENFNNVTSFGTTIEWNAGELEYIETNTVLPNFLPLANLNTTATSDGSLGAIWFDLSGVTPLTIADGAAVMEICYEVIGTQNNSVSTIAMTSSSTPLAVSVAGATPADPVLSAQAIVTPGSFTVQNGCNTNNPLICNSFLNISTGPFDCTASLTPEMVLEGTYDPSLIVVAPSVLTANDLGNNVQYTVTDVSNNNTCWGTIAYSDMTPPVAIVNNQLILTLEDSSDCKVVLTAAEIDEGSYDICGAISYRSGPWEFSYDHLGAQTIEFVICDESDNCNTAVTTVIIEQGTCTLPVAYDQVNILLDGRDTVAITPAMVLYPNWNADNFTITLTMVDTSNLGDNAFFVDDNMGNDDTGIIKVCETGGKIIGCSKIIETITSAGIGEVTIDQALADIDHSCTDKGWITSFSNSRNDETSFLVDCSGANTPGGILPENYVVYLWTGNILVDSCTNMVQVLDGANYCDNSTTFLACNNHVNVSVDLWGCTADLTPEMVLEGGPYDYTNMTIVPSTLSKCDKEITYTVTDDTTGNSCWGTITAEDKIPPVAVSKSNIILQLSTSSGSNSEPTGKVFVESVDNGSHDGDCGDVALKPDFWTFGCGDIGINYVTMQVWDDADCDGIPGSSLNDNVNEVLVEILVEYDIPIVNSFDCPSDVTIKCTDDITDTSLTGVPSVQDVCLTYVDTRNFDANGDGDVDDVYEDANGVFFKETYNVVCNQGLIAREWMLGDNSCVQVIAVANASSFDESDIVWPIDKDFGCDETLETELPSWTDNGCDLIGVTVDSENIGACSANGSLANVKVVNHFTVINWCEYDPQNSTTAGTWTYTNVLKRIDNEPPVSSIEDGHTYDCVNTNESIAISAVDDCNPLTWIYWTVFLDLNNDGTNDYEWSSTIDAGTSPWDDSNSNGVPDVRIGAESQDNLSKNYTTSYEKLELQLPSIPSSTNLHKVAWTIEDECGNRTTLESFFYKDDQADQDNVKPTPYCVSTFTVPMYDGKVEVSTADFNLNSFDNCTSEGNLEFTFTNVRPPSRCDAAYASASDLEWYNGSFWFFDASEASTGTSGACPLDNEGAYSNGGYNVSTGGFETFESDIHKWLPGLKTSSAIFKESDFGSNGQLAVNLYVWDQAGNSDFCTINLRYIVEEEEECFLTADNINWPEEILTIQGAVSATDISVEALIEIYQYTQDDVEPLFPDCAEAISTYSDVVIDLQNGGKKIVRTWVVLDWLAATTFEFDQIINVNAVPVFICDILPNDAPVGDCNSGHTLDDDVEWPADIEINDHRIAPNELLTFSGVPAKDIEPIFFNSSAYYTAVYSDLVYDLSQLPTKLLVERVWTVISWLNPSQTWTYSQKITVNVVGFNGLVSVNTLNNRPMAAVQVTDNASTNDLGLATVAANEVIELEYSDTALNGLNIRDMVLLENHILGLDELNSSQLLAADVNNDASLNAVDVVELKKVILGFYDEFPQNENWRFYDRSGALAELSTKGNYLGVKTGDIDDTAILANESPILAEGMIFYDDVLMNNGQTYNVDLDYELDDFYGWGIELGFDIDETQIVIDSISSSISGGNLDYNIKDGRLKVVVHSSRSAEMIGEGMLTLHLSAIANTTLGQSLSLSEEASYLLDENLELQLLVGELQGVLVSGTHQIEGKDIKLYPNPASTTLFVDIPAAYQANMSLTIYDINGRSVLQSTKTRIDVSHLVNGLYSYTLKLGTKTFNDKVLIYQ